MRVHPHPLTPQVPILTGMALDDHVAHVVTPGELEQFARFWTERGYAQLPALETTRYPAQHIGFTNPDEPNQPMVALSVSSDDASPINRFIKLYGSHRLTETGEIAMGSVQHIAYRIDPSVTTIEAVVSELSANGIRFMTPILSHIPNPTSELKQVFVACSVPWGPFVELVQRTALPVTLTEPNGIAKQGFASDQIDILYDHYHHYSLALI